MHHNLPLTSFVSLLETNIEKQKKRKGVVSPPVGKSNIILIDDIHMASKDFYNCRKGLEVIRSWFC
jgi:hypothetical protein